MLIGQADGWLPAGVQFPDKTGISGPVIVRTLLPVKGQAMTESATPTPARNTTAPATTSGF
jgi:hypothetical protein